MKKTTVTASEWDRYVNLDFAHARIATIRKKKKFIEKSSKSYSFLRLRPRGVAARKANASRSTASAIVQEGNVVLCVNASNVLIAMKMPGLKGQKI